VTKYKAVVAIAAARKTKAATQVARIRRMHTSPGLDRPKSLALALRPRQVDRRHSCRGPRAFPERHRSAIPGAAGARGERVRLAGGEAGEHAIVIFTDGGRKERLARRVRNDDIRDVRLAVEVEA